MGPKLRYPAVLPRRIGITLSHESWDRVCAEALDIDDFFEWAKKSQHSAAMMDKLNRVTAKLKVGYCCDCEPGSLFLIFWILAVLTVGISVVGKRCLAWVPAPLQFELSIPRNCAWNGS